MMSLNKRIELICEGKTIRIFSVKEERSVVSFVESYRNCGKQNCARCKDRSQRPHGPYWTLNYIDDHGKSRSLYVGKSLPAIAGSERQVTFADVIALYREREEHRETIGTSREEIRRLKREVARLVEELALLRRLQQRRSTYRPATNDRAEKIFKQLAVKYHPDRNGHRHFSAEDVMKDINQLYQNLARK